MIGFEICMTYYMPNQVECTNWIKNFKGVASVALANKYANPDVICTYISWCTTPVIKPENFTAWTATVMAGKPSGPTVNSTIVTPSNFTFVHMSDIHIDLQYQVGATTACSYTVCCRNGTGAGLGVAGTWGGSAQCDMPLKTLEGALGQIKALNPAFIIITGDIPPHDNWKESYASNINYFQAVANSFGKVVPNIPLFPIYGNHANFPINQYQYNSTGGWLPDPWVNSWNLTKLSSDIAAQLKAHAGYSVLFNNSTISKLRMIAIDTQTGNNDNAWLLANSTNPQGIITWLYSELQKAELNQEKVYLFGHIPPGFQDTLTVFSKHINVLMDRFQYTIAGSFFGHLHSDNFQINRGVYSGNPTNVQWINPSFTTWNAASPSFRVYTADTVSKGLLNYDQYRLSLSNANLYVSFSKFVINYSFLSYYSVPNMNLTSVNNLVLKMKTNEVTALLYLWKIFNNTAPSPSCDPTCLAILQCQLSYGVNDDVINCAKLSSGFTYKVLDYIYGPWSYIVSS